MKGGMGWREEEGGNRGGTWSPTHNKNIGAN